MAQRFLNGAMMGGHGLVSGSWAEAAVTRAGMRGGPEWLGLGEMRLGEIWMGKNEDGTNREDSEVALPRRPSSLGYDLRLLHFFPRIVINQ